VSPVWKVTQPQLGGKAEATRRRRRPPPPPHPPPASQPPISQSQSMIGCSKQSPPLPIQKRPPRLESALQPEDHSSMQPANLTGRVVSDGVPEVHARITYLESTYIYSISPHTHTRKTPCSRSMKP